MKKHFFVLALCLAAGPSAAEDSAWKKAERPDWVTPIPWELPAGLPDEAPSGGVTYILFDYQVDRRRTESAYSHTVKQLVDQAGVQSESTVSMTFDSLFQRLEVHGIRIYRDGVEQDRLAGAAFDVVRQESNREERLFQATKSVSAYLDDVRVGDILEYEYTIHGSNPVFDGHYFDGINMKWPVPVERAYRSILWPAGRPLYFQERRSDREPERRREGDVVRFVWDESAVPALLADGDLPSWYDPLPWLQVSSMKSWSEVVDWGLPLYSLQDEPPPELKRLVLESAGEGADAKQLASAALRVVQDEIRYLYIGLAEGSHRPNPPALVAERRFGDCKDKSVLLVTLLRDLGIEAAPALVATDWRGEVQHLLPSPFQFDHVIVRVRIDGQTYWMDGTDSHQRGTLDRLASPGLGAALVLAPGTGGFEEIPLEDLTEPSSAIHARLRLGDGEGAVDFEVETTYRGSYADGTRYSLSTTSPEETQKQYLDYYGNLYPSLEALAAVEWDDDPDENVITLREHYRVPDFWTMDNAGAWREGELYPLELESVLSRPSTVNRSMPLGVAHPVHTTYVIDAFYDLGWTIEDEMAQVENDAFVFERSVSSDADRLRIAYSYRSKTDQLPPAAGPDYNTEVDKAFALLSFPVQLAVGFTEGVELRQLNWSLVFLSLVTLVLAIVGARRLYRWQPELPPLDPGKASQVEAGLGGWLVLVGLGVVAAPLRFLVAVLTGLEVYSLPLWTAYTSPDEPSFHALWAPVLLGETLFNIVALVFAVLLVVLFFRKRRAFPRLYVIFIVGTAVFGCLDVYVAAKLPGTVPGTMAQAYGQVLGAMIWAWYALVSVRVRKTFVE